MRYYRADGAKTGTKCFDAGILRGLVLLYMQAVVFCTVGRTKTAGVTRHLNLSGMRNGQVSEAQAEDAGSSNDTCIISCSRDGCVKLWDAQSGLCLKTFTATDAAEGWGGSSAAAGGSSWVRCVCVPEQRLRPAPFFATGGNDQRQVACSLTLPCSLQQPPPITQVT